MSSNMYGTERRTQGSSFTSIHMCGKPYIYFKLTEQELNLKTNLYAKMYTKKKRTEKNYDLFTMMFQC